MPVFPSYERDQGLDFGRVPQVDTGYGALVSGVKQLAAGVGEAGDAMQQYQERLKTQSMFDDNVKTDRYREESKNALKQWQLTGVPENATGAAQAFMATRQKPNADFLATISPQNRDHFAKLLTVDQTSILGAAAETETVARNKYELGHAQTLLDSWMTTLRADPSQKDEAVKDLGVTIDHTTALSPAQKAEAKKNIDANLSSAKWQAVYANDPAAGMRALGIEMPKAKTAGGVTQAVNAQIPAQGRALLDTIAGTESPGYDTRYGGAKFSGFADHPRIGEVIKSGPNKGRTSAAAGRYQFLPATWDAEAKKLGLKDFSPASQDAAAWDLAQTEYREKTGGNLEQALQSSNAETVANVGRVLSGQWTSLPGGIEAGTNSSKFAAAFAKNAGRYGNIASPQDAADAGGHTRDTAPTGSIEKPLIVGGDPEYAAIPYDMRVKLADQAQRDYSTMQTQQAADLKLQQSTLQNSLQNMLIDGKAGLPDIEKARQAGWLSDADAVEKMRGIVEKRDKDQADGRMFMQGLGTPGTQFNPFDATQQKGADEAFKAMGGSLKALDTIFGASGIVPKSSATMMKSGIFGTDQAAGSQTLQVASNILAKNPNAFRAVDGGTDIANSAVKFQHFLSQGQTVAAATARVMQENDTSYKPKNAVNDADLKTFTDGITSSSVGKLFDQSNLPFTDPRVGANPDQMTSIISDFREVATDFYKQSGDPKLALAQTKAQMEKVYGVTKVLGQDTLTKYPPEKAYPPVGGSYDYILHQAEQEVANVIGRHLLPSDVGLFQAPQTERDFLAGKPVPYQVVYYDTKNGQRTMEILPGGLFVADPGAAQKESRAVIQPKLDAAQAAVMQTEDNFAKAQQDADARARMNTAPTPQAAAAVTKRPITPPPPTQLSPAQTLQKQMQDVRGAGMKDMPSLGFGAGENWPDN